MKNSLIWFSFFAISMALVEAQEEKTYYSPSGQVDLCHDVGLSASSSFLYWVAEEQGLAYLQGGSPETGNIIFDGPLKKIKPDFTPAFKVDLGYTFRHNKWNIDAEYTDFRTKKDDTTDSLGVILWGHQNSSSNYAASSYAKWKLHYQTIDLQLSYPFYCGKHFSVNPFLGGRGAFINQKFSIFYDNWTAVASTHHTHYKTDSFGLKAGSGLDFAFPKGFGVNGLFSLSLLYGYGKCHYKVEAVNGTIYVDSYDHNHRFLPALQLAGFFYWGNTFCHDRAYIKASIGWESNIYFGFNQMYRFMHYFYQGIYSKNEGSLTLQGLTVSLLFKF